MIVVYYALIENAIRFCIIKLKKLLIKLLIMQVAQVIAYNIIKNRPQYYIKKYLRLASLRKNSLTIPIFGTFIVGDGYHNNTVMAIDFGLKIDLKYWNYQ